MTFETAPSLRDVENLKRQLDAIETHRLALHDDFAEDGLEGNEFSLGLDYGLKLAMATVRRVTADIWDEEAEKRESWKRRS